MIATTCVPPLCGFLTLTRYCDIVECTDSVDGPSHMWEVRKWKDTREGGES